MDSSAAIQQLGNASVGISRLIGATPFSPSVEDQKLLAQLFHARDKLNWTAQQLIGMDLSANLAGSQQALAAIQAATNQLNAVQSAVTSAQKVLGIVSEVVSAASAILAEVAV